MGYMNVETHTGSVLHLKRSPGLRSWSLLVGIACVGLTAAYYSSDSLAWRLFYVCGCLLVALQNMELWEEARFDKSNNRVELSSLSLYASLLTLRGGDAREKVVLDLTQLCDVCVQEEKVRYLGKGYLLMLRLTAGFSYPLTHSATLGGQSDVEAVARLLKRFLGLEDLQRHGPEEEEEEEEEEEDFGEEEDSVDDSSDDMDHEDTAAAAEDH